MQYKLSDLYTFSNGINTAKENYGKGRKMISVMDILSTEYLYYDNIINSVNVSQKIEQRNRVEENDLLFVRSSETRDEVGWTKAYKDNKYSLFSGFVIRGSAVSNNNSFFVEASLNYKNRRQIETVAEGSTRYNIGQKTLQDVSLLLPALEEQYQITKFLESLDYIITLEQEKLNYLYSLKIFLLENLLTSKEELPSIRFNNYNNLWRKYKLSDLGNTISGVGFPIKEQKGLKGIPFYKVSDMNNIGNEVEMNQANNYVSEEQISENKWNPIDKLPSIIFAKVGAALMLNRKRYVSHKFLIDNNMMAFSANQNNNGKFIKHVFDTIYLPRYAQVGALPSLSGKDINNISIFLPSKEEQNKIVNILNLIDKLINNSQQKLNNMRTAKEYLLNNLFV